MATLSQRKLDSIQGSLRELMEGDDDMVGRIMDIIHQHVDMQKHLAKNRELQKRFLDKVKAETGSGYTEADKRYYQTHKEELKARRIARKMQQRVQT
jgi:hypothetical protein